MYSAAAQFRTKAADEASRKAASKAATSKRTDAEKRAYDETVKTRALALNAEQDAKFAAKMAAYHAKKGRPHTP